MHNVLIAIGNAEGAANNAQRLKYLTAAESRLADTAPLVRVAVWALANISPLMT